MDVDVIEIDDKENNLVQQPINTQNKPTKGTGWFTRPNTVDKSVTQPSVKKQKVSNTPVTKQQSLFAKQNANSQPIVMDNDNNIDVPVVVLDTHKSADNVVPQSTVDAQATNSTVAINDAAMSVSPTHTVQSGTLSASPHSSPTVTQSSSSPAMNIADQLLLCQSINTKIHQLESLFVVESLDTYMSTYVIKNMLIDLPPHEYKRYMQRHIDVILKHVPTTLVDGMHHKVLNSINKIDDSTVEATQPNKLQSISLFTTPAPIKHKPMSTIKHSPVSQSSSAFSDTINTLVHSYNDDSTVALQQTIQSVNDLFTDVFKSIPFNTKSLHTPSTQPKLSAAAKQRLKEETAAKREAERIEKQKLKDAEVEAKRIEREAKQKQLDETKRLKQLELDQQKAKRDAERHSKLVAEQQQKEAKLKAQLKLFSFLNTNGTTTTVSPTMSPASKTSDTDMCINDTTTVTTEHTPAVNKTKRKLDERLFYPYEPPTNATVAPIYRSKRRTVDQLDTTLFDVNNTQPIKHTARKHTYKHCISVSRRNKLLQYHENYRPAYYGRYNKSTTMFNGRCPFGKDATQLNYEEDSGDDWDSEPEDGEDLVSDGLCSEDESDDGSRADGLEDDGFVAEIDESEKLHNNTLNKHTLIPRIIGPIVNLQNTIDYIKNNKNQTQYSDKQIYDYNYMLQYKVVKLMNGPINRVHIPKPVILKPEKPIKLKKPKLSMLKGAFNVFKRKDFELNKELRLLCDNLIATNTTSDTIKFDDSIESTTVQIQQLFQQQNIEQEFPYLNQWLLPLIPDAKMTPAELAITRKPKPKVESVVQPVTPQSTVVADSKPAIVQPVTVAPTPVLATVVHKPAHSAPVMNVLQPKRKIYAVLPPTVNQSVIPIEQQTNTAQTVIQPIEIE